MTDRWTVTQAIPPRLPQLKSIPSLRPLVGISAAARLLDFYARRPQLQERLGQQVADHLDRLIRPRGVAVVLEARHLCMEMRGVRKRGDVETRAVRGELADPRWAALLQFKD